MLGVKAVQQELARRRLAATAFNLPMLKDLYLFKKEKSEIQSVG
jgi:hypothetical protein